MDLTLILTRDMVSRRLVSRSRRPNGIWAYDHSQSHRTSWTRSSKPWRLATFSGSTTTRASTTCEWGSLWDRIVSSRLASSFTKLTRRVISLTLEASSQVSLKVLKKHLSTKKSLKKHVFQEETAKVVNTDTNIVSHNMMEFFELCASLIGSLAR